MQGEELEILVKDCVAGKRKAQQQLFNLYSDNMYGVCLYYSKDYTEAEDTLHEGFMKVFQKIEQFKFKGSLIDTLRVSKHLIQECDGYSLQFLRYELKLYKEEIPHAMACGIDGDVISHNALSDALIVKLLYNYLLEISSLAQMLDLSFKNVLLQKFEFGKYSGRYIEEIGMCDRGYLEWMLSVADIDEDLRYSINYYLNP